MTGSVLLFGAFQLSLEISYLLLQQWAVGARPPGEGALPAIAGVDPALALAAFRRSISLC